MRHLNRHQRVALSIAVAAVALVIGQGVGTRFFQRDGWFGYAPITSTRLFAEAPPGRVDAVLWMAWWVVVITVATAVVLWLLKDPPAD